MDASIYAKSPYRPPFIGRAHEVPAQRPMLSLVPDVPADVVPDIEVPLTAA